jgi:hypothetical protein
MEKDELVRRLTDDLAPQSENTKKARETASKFSPRNADQVFLHEVAKPIEHVLAIAEPFSRGSGYLVQRDNGFVGFNAREASVALTRRVLRGDAPTAAVGWLEKVLRTEEAVGRGILALWGVEVEGAVDLGSDVCLVPFGALPDSAEKRWLEQPLEPFAVTPSFLASMFCQPPTAALMCPQKVRPFLTSTKTPPTPQKAPLQLNELLHDARLALTVIGPSCPVSAGYWFQFDDPDLADASLYGGILSSHQEVVPHGIVPPVRLDPHEAHDIVSAFFRLRGNPPQAKIRIALSRLNQAMRRPPHGDRTLDLAIALESLLVDGAGENTFKLGLRCGLLLPGSIERRRSVRSVIGALYTLRSALAHDGVLPSEVKVVGQGKKPSAQIVEEATRVCAEVLRTILLSGWIPDWYASEIAGAPVAPAASERSR